MQLHVENFNLKKALKTKRSKTEICYKTIHNQYGWTLHVKFLLKKFRMKCEVLFLGSPDML